jgi:hypothetical protein
MIGCSQVHSSYAFYAVTAIEGQTGRAQLWLQVTDNLLPISLQAIFLDPID